MSIVILLDDRYHLIVKRGPGRNAFHRKSRDPAREALAHLRAAGLPGAPVTKRASLAMEGRVFCAHALTLNASCRGFIYAGETGVYMSIARGIPRMPSDGLDDMGRKTWDNSGTVRSCHSVISSDIT